MIGAAKPKRRRTNQANEPIPRPADDAPWWEHAEYDAKVAAKNRADHEKAAKKAANAAAKATAKAAAKAAARPVDPADPAQPSEEEIEPEVEVPDNLEGCEERNVDDLGLAADVLQTEAELVANKKREPTRHMDPTDGAGGLAIRHPARIDGGPAPYCASDPLNPEGFKTDDCYVSEASGPVILVPRGECLGNIWKFGKTWKCKCMTDGQHVVYASYWA